MSKKTTHLKDKKKEIRNPLYNDIMTDRQINPKKRAGQAKATAIDEVWRPSGFVVLTH